MHRTLTQKESSISLVAELTKGILQFSVRDLRLFLDLSQEHFIAFIEQSQDRYLINIQKQFIPLNRECSVDFDRSIVMEPGQIALFVFVLVEHFELCCQAFQ